jgi:hypothetical protein
MPDQAITMNLDPGAHRQLGEDGLIVLWRDGRELGRREGLACIMSVCPHVECAWNDPCSCGSGKKFKKCCQGKGEPPTSEP